MTREEELEQLRRENSALREAGRSLDEDLQHARTSNQDLREGLKAIGSQSEHITALEGLITSLQELLGVQLSAGSIANFVTTCHQQLAEVETHLKAALVKAKVIHQDETGLRVGTDGWWVHVCSTTTRPIRAEDGIWQGFVSGTAIWTAKVINACIFNNM